MQPDKDHTPLPKTYAGDCARCPVRLEKEGRKKKCCKKYKESKRCKKCPGR